MLEARQISLGNQGIGRKGFLPRVRSLFLFWFAPPHLTIEHHLLHLRLSSTGGWYFGGVECGGVSISQTVSYAQNFWHCLWTTFLHYMYRYCVTTSIIASLRYALTEHFIEQKCMPFPMNGEKQKEAYLKHTHWEGSMSYSIPLGHAAGILAAIYAEGAVYQALSVQNRTLKDGGATIYPSGKKSYILNILSLNCSRAYNTAQCPRCQLGCSGSQNFPCIPGSCYRSILSKIRVWES